MVKKKVIKKSFFLYINAKKYADWYRQRGYSVRIVSRKKVIYVVHARKK